MSKNFLVFLKNNTVVLDGAFGTELQKRGIRSTKPEMLNLTDESIVADIHRAYVEAGSDVIYTNTFGANLHKLGSEKTVSDCIKAAVKIARDAAKDKFVALDIGASGCLIEPLGKTTFEEAYELFAMQARCADGCDLVVIETIGDLAEMKAALLAVRENCTLPIICSMTFAENRRTFTGCDAKTFALAAAPFADALGINCSLGAKEIFPIAKELAEFTDKPILIKANAGLPDKDMVFSEGKEEFLEYYERYLDMGVALVGGCCGTTPEYVKGLRALVDSRKKIHRNIPSFSAVSSHRKTVSIDGVTVVGERINPTGKKAMKAALINGDYGYVAEQALSQVEAGAKILDVNAGLPEIDETVVLPKLVRYIQSLTDAPLQIDSANPIALENALRVYVGKPIVNSVNGEDKVLDTILPLVKKYGAAVIGLTIDENGLPKTATERIRIAEKILAKAKDYGIDKNDVFIDCLSLTVSSMQEQAGETLAAVRELSAREIKTTLGVSNISFGLPNRQIINSAFLNAALFSGLTLPIINPNVAENMQTVAAYRVLCGEDKNCADYTKDYASIIASTTVKAEKQPLTENAVGLTLSIKKALPKAVTQTEELLLSVSPIDVINDHLLPALNAVGEDFEKGILFLPQLIASAETAKLCFDAVKKRLPKDALDESKIIVLATVKGDIHDIGKNIVKTVLENYGYKIIDLGCDTEPTRVLSSCKESGAKLLGLSALMTTTVSAMEQTVKLVKAELPACKIMVGGAVLTADYAASIGADFYCKDANASVKVANLVFKV